MSRLDGRRITRPIDLDADIVVVGSGPAGAVVAADAAAVGARVVIVEAGPWFEPSDFPLSGFAAMSQGYRAMGASVFLGPAPMPYLQGKMVGGSSPINGAICWRLPQDIHEEWLRADPALGAALPWEVIEAAQDHIEHRLGVAPTDPAVAGAKNLLMAAGADALGLENRPIRRNTRGCEGLGRCMQGCPAGRKQSVDRTFVTDALADGARLVSSASVFEVTVEGGRAVGVSARTDGGSVARIRAHRAVVLAASAIQTPALLLQSRITQGPVGRHLQCHPGVSMAGRFDAPVRLWEGATQGHEVIGLRREGLKFEALGFDLAVLATRLSGVGRALSASIEDMAHWADWGAAVRAQAEGRVRSVLGAPVVTYTPTAHDVTRFRRGLAVLGRLMFAAGATEVLPGVRGFDARVTDPQRLDALEHDGPTGPGAFMSAVTHMFGTCRMGADPGQAVVRPDFRHHQVDQLYVADSSVFPTNTGVNPQVPIMALARLCARRVLAG